MQRTSPRFEEPRFKPEAKRRLLRVSLLVLIVWFNISDTVLKFFPDAVALPLRYLPEALVYGLGLMVGLQRQIRRSGTGRRFPLALPFVAFGVAIGLSTFLRSTSIVDGVVDFRLFFRFVPLAYVAYEAFADYSDSRTLRKFAVVLALVQACFAMLQLVGGPLVFQLLRPRLVWADATRTVDTLVHEGFGWLSTTFADYNAFGFFMLMVTMLALLWWIQERARLAAVFLPIGYICVLLSFSRHSVVSLGVYTVVALFLTRSYAITARVAGIAVLSTVGLLVMFFGASDLVGHTLSGNAVSDRVETIFSSGVTEGTLQENVRLYLIMSIPERILDTSPLVGVGSGASTALGNEDSESLPPEIAEIGTEALRYISDVVWLSVLLNYGLFGLSALLWCFGVLLNRSVRLRQRATVIEDELIGNIGLIWTLILLSSAFFSLEIIARDTVPIYWVFMGLVLRRHDTVMETNADATEAPQSATMQQAMSAV